MSEARPSQETQAASELYRRLVDFVRAAAPDELGVGAGKADVVLQVVVDGVQFRLSDEGLSPEPERAHLSPREKEIVRLIARGQANKTIAAVLEVSPWTVATHVRRIFEKLGVSSRAEMVARVLEDGLLAEH